MPQDLLNQTTQVQYLPSSPSYNHATNKHGGRRGPSYNATKDAAADGSPNLNRENFQKEFLLATALMRWGSGQYLKQQRYGEDADGYGNYYTWVHVNPVI
ncbi:hypothetical protein Tco_1517809 [Tanacetum coccineum]